MAPTDDTEPTREQLAQVSALADGSLAPDRRAAVEKEVAAAPELTRRYLRERQAVDALHQLSSSDRAPERLRAAVARQLSPGESAGSSAKPRRGVGRPAYALTLAGAVCALVAVLLLVLPAGSVGGPSVSEAAALALRGPAEAAPAPDPGAPATQLAEQIQGLYFPNWGASLGWKAAGRRTDRLSGRAAATVFYRWRGQVAAYTIVALPSLKEPPARTSQVDGLMLRTLSSGGRTIVTWRRSGHTCVLSARSVPAGVLQRLAAWNEHDLNR